MVVAEVIRCVCSRVVSAYTNNFAATGSNAARRHDDRLSSFCLERKEMRLPISMFVCCEKSPRFGRPYFSVQPTTNCQLDILHSELRTMQTASILSDLTSLRVCVGSFLPDSTACNLTNAQGSLRSSCASIHPHIV